MNNDVIFDKGFQKETVKGAEYWTVASKTILGPPTFCFCVSWF